MLRALGDRLRAHFSHYDVSEDEVSTRLESLSMEGGCKLAKAEHSRQAVPPARAARVRTDSRHLSNAFHEPFEPMNEGHKTEQ